MENKTNGSDMAYPIVCEEVRGVWQQGLTKREYIASQQYAAMITNPEYGTLSLQKIAVTAVRATDALIEELNKNGN